MPSTIIGRFICIEARVHSVSFKVTAHSYSSEQVIIMLSIRVLVKHMDLFSGQAKTVQWHIPSLYTAEMATKSEVVSICLCPVLLSMFSESSNLNNDVHACSILVYK